MSIDRDHLTALARQRTRERGWILRGDVRIEALSDAYRLRVFYRATAVGEGAFRPSTAATKP